MPFRIAEVVEMSRILRDVVLGLITFMFPDIKMFNANGVRQKQWHTLCQVNLFYFSELFHFFQIFVLLFFIILFFIILFFFYNSNEFESYSETFASYFHPSYFQII